VLIETTTQVCPYAHRAELALKESGLDYKRFEIDLQNKPEWYAPKVNPASKVSLLELHLILSFSPYPSAPISHLE
jgi:glutathione S-transferase